MCSFRHSNLRLLPTLWGLLLPLVMAGCGSASLESIRQQQAAGNFEATLEPLRELLRERQNDAEVQFLYGNALAGTGQFGLAEWSLREAMNDPEWLVPAGLALARSALRTYNLNLALETADRLVEARPDDVDVRLMRANAIVHSHSELEQALEEVERILELDPENVEVMEPKILALIGLERIDEAAAAIAELGQRIEEAELGVKLAGWHCATAALFAEESGETELAEERWSACVERFPSHSNVIGNAVNYYNARGQLDRSLELVRRAHELEPASREYRGVLAQILRDLGSAEEAEALLREAAEAEHPQLAATAWYDLVKHHQALEQFPEAAEAAVRGIEAARLAGQPLAQLQLEYADSLLITGDHDRALAIAEEMTVPAHQWMIRARVAQEQDRPAEALEYFTKGFELWPDNPWARYYAALAAETLGDFDRAVDEYRYAIRIDAAATDARVRVARLHLAEGKPLEALTLLRVGSPQLGIDGELLSIELYARSGRDAQLRRSLAIFQESIPAELGPALTRAARGLRARRGPTSAVAMLRDLETRGMELTHPMLADPLRSLVRYSHELGRLGEAEASVRAALEAHPESAALHATLGLALELRGAPEASASYEQALALEPADVEALTGLGRLALDSEPERALVYFEKAAAADPNDPEPLRGAARAWVASDRPEEAERRLDALLLEHPYDGRASEVLAELQLQRGAADASTLERARRAVRFGGGADALDLLSRVYRQRDEIELAEQAAARAATLRARPGAPAEEPLGGKKSS